MSGQRVPYHLRHNKAIDRNLFLELLTMINRYVHISKYTYIGFGGSFLEDFKLIHNQTGIKSMISIENDKRVVKRQNFNRPINCIDLRQIDSEKFIEDYSLDSSVLIWLDYADPKALSKHLNEVESLASKLKHGDVLRVTLNANIKTLRGDNARPAEGKTIQDERYEKFNNRYDKYVTGENAATIYELMTPEGYPTILCKALKYVLKKGTDGLPVYFQPLTAFAYNDSYHTMLTFCGIILMRNEEKDFFNKTEINKWKLSTVKGEPAKKIDIPELSIRERLLIDSLLPELSASEIIKRLKFYTGEDRNETLKEIENYRKYYRHYPYFSKVIP